MRGEKMSKTEDEKYMFLALEEAKKGIGRTSPNPCVGAVLVRDREVVGRGYHKKAGTPHAEVHALADAGNKSQGATIYVTLEPCSHYGRTPPCCEAVAAAGVTRVVIGMLDPNPLVNGRGVKFLKDKGIEVISKVLEKECIDINRPFIKKITTGLPWMVMKAGVSLEGRINYQKGKTGWITGPEAKTKVHQLRNQIDAIMVGSGTVKIDNPSLTTRLDKSDVRNPVRVILDTNLKTDINSKVYLSCNEDRVYVFCAQNVSVDVERKFLNAGVKVFRVSCNEEGKLSLQEIMKILGEHDVNSVLVEGGSGVHGQMIKENLYDYVYLFYAPVFAGTGGVPLTTGHSVNSREDRVTVSNPIYTQIGNDLLVEGSIRDCYEFKS